MRSRSAVGSPISQAVVPPQVVDDGRVHRFAADADRAGGDDVRQADDGHFGRAVADVADQAGHRLGHGQARAERGGDGLGDQQHLPGAGAGGAVVEGPLLDGRDRAGGGDEHARPQHAALVLSLAEEVAQHGFAQLEVADHAFGQGPDDGDRAGRAAFHLTGQVSDGAAAGQNAIGAFGDGDDGGLVDDEAFAAAR